MQAVTMQQSVFTPYQMQMLDAVSHVRNNDDMKAIREILSWYFAEKAQMELDKLWDNGTINESVIQMWKNEHMRIPAEH